MISARLASGAARIITVATTTPIVRCLARLTIFFAFRCFVDVPGYRKRRQRPSTARAFSSFADDFLDAAQEGVAIHHRRRRVIEDPLLADHTLRVDEKERPDRGHYLLVEDSISPDDLPFDEVAQQRIRQLQGFGERLLRERVVGADGENLNTQGFEPLVVGLPGR